MVMTRDYVFPGAPLTQAASRLAGRIRMSRLDAAGAEAIKQMWDVGIPSILLRGPAIVRLLYGPSESRVYSDCDILVPEARHAEAEGILETCGYSPILRRDALRDQAWHALTWRRDSDWATIDLHRSLIGAKALPSLVWEVLNEHSSTVETGGGRVRMPDAPGVALIVALHVAGHGPRWSKPHQDLARAIARFSRDEWEQAARMARKMQAAGAMRAGLSLVGGGESLALALHLDEPSTETMLRASSPDGLVLNLHAIWTARGIARKAKLLGRAVFPTRTRMESRYPLARRGHVGLAIAYTGRLFVLMGRLPENLRLWRVVRRSSRN